MLPAFLQWKHNGRSAGNGWNSPVNNAKWGTDYLNRTGTGKSNIYDNRPEETKYIYTDDDNQGQQLNGQNSYAITFPKGQTPPVKGFWSLTLYDTETRAIIQNRANDSARSGLDTLETNPDGSVDLYWLFRN
jgi:hypothetical protein